MKLNREAETQTEGYFHFLCPNKTLQQEAAGDTMGTVQESLASSKHHPKAIGIGIQGTGG